MLTVGQKVKAKDADPGPHRGQQQQAQSRSLNSGPEGPSAGLASIL